LLKQRVVTALVLVVIFLGALFGLSPYGFALFAGGAILLAFREWANLSALGRLPSFVYLLVAAGAITGMFQYLGLASLSVQLELLKPLLLAACLWWAIALLLVQGYPSSAILWGSWAVRLVMGAFVLLPPWLALAWLVTLEGGRWLVIVVILAVACADIGAYFCGRAFGRRKLAPEVSPGKTLEGFVGGILAVMLVISVVIALSPSQRHVWLEWAIVMFFTVLAAALGDLLESMIKRHRGVKDSGTILPGHGGLLDRLDSLCAALPVFSLLYLLLIHSQP